MRLEVSSGVDDKVSVPEVGAEPTDQADKAHRSESAGASGGPDLNERNVFDGLHARQSRMRQVLPTPQRY